jgi:hypothetical protein
VSGADLAIMRRIDELHLDYPFAGSRMMRDLLRGEGVVIGRERVTTMMLRMGIEAIYRRPHTSKPADGHEVFPYLLRGIPSAPTRPCGRNRKPKRRPNYAGAKHVRRPLSARRSPGRPPPSWRMVW